MQEMSKQYATVKEYAELMRVCERTVRRWIKAKKITAVRKGDRGQYRIPIK